MIQTDVRAAGERKVERFSSSGDSVYSGVVLFYMTPSLSVSQLVQRAYRWYDLSRRMQIRCCLHKHHREAEIYKKAIKGRGEDLVPLAF